MSADVMSSSPVKQPAEPTTVTPMETSDDVPNSNEEEKPLVIDPTTDDESKTTKRKRSTKKTIETDETSISNTRPKRTLSKREEIPPVTTNGNGKSVKSKAQRASTEQTAGDADDEQEREKNIPMVYDVADVVWVKMGGHPWWPSLIIRDPNDSTRCFTKITGNARPKRMYFVVFYGSTADFAWVSDAAIIPYQGVEAFTTYAQETVDKAVTKSQKEQLTERFQLKVTIGRREDWEMAVREADAAVKQSSETRLEQIEPKVQFYTSKLVPSKGQPGRRRKTSGENNDPALNFPSDDETENDEDFSDDSSSVKKSSSTTKLKLKKQTSNDDDFTNTPPAKRRYVRKSTEPVGNGSHPSQSPSDANLNGSTNVKKRGRPPRLSKPSVISSNHGEKTIIKPQAFMTKPHPVSSLNQVLAGQHHRFDIRTGFLTPFEEQEVFDAIDQLPSKKSFEEVEQIARRRFEHILCLNLNRTHVDVPEEWFYSFLFAHPILIVKNPQWFDVEKSSVDSLLKDVKITGLTSLKHQLIILSKLYRNELQVRPTTV